MMMMMIAAAGKTPRLPNICLLAATYRQLQRLLIWAISINCSAEGVVVVVVVCPHHRTQPHSNINVVMVIYAF